MNAAAALRDGIWLPLAAAVVATVVAAGLSIWVLGGSLGGATDKATVLRVCLDGTLVLRLEDGDIEVIRPGATRGWRAIGPEVCQ